MRLSLTYSTRPLAGLLSSFIKGRTVCARSAGYMASRQKAQVRSRRVLPKGFRFMLFPTCESDGLGLDRQGASVSACRQVRQRCQVNVEIHHVVASAALVVA